MKRVLPFSLAFALLIPFSSLSALRAQVPAQAVRGSTWLFSNRLPAQPTARPSALSVPATGPAGDQLSAALSRLRERCPSCRLPDEASLQSWLGTPFFKKLAEEPFFKQSAKELLLDDGTLKSIRFSYGGKTYTVVPGEQVLYVKADKEASVEKEGDRKPAQTQVLSLKEDGSWAPVDLSHESLKRAPTAKAEFDKYAPKSAPAATAFSKGPSSPSLPNSVSSPLPNFVSSPSPKSVPSSPLPKPSSPPPSPKPSPAPGEVQRIHNILARVNGTAAELKSGKDLDSLLGYLKAPDSQYPDLRVRVAEVLVAGFHKNEGYLWDSGEVRAMGRKIKTTLTELLQDREASAADPTLGGLARSFIALKPSKEEIRALLNGPHTAGRLQLAMALSCDPSARETYREELSSVLRQTLQAPRDQSPFKGGCDQARRAAIRALADPVTLPSSWIPWRSERQVTMAGELLKAVGSAPADHELLYGVLGAVSRNRAFYSKAENWQTGVDLLDAVLKARAPEGSTGWEAVQARAKALKAYIGNPSPSRDPGPDVPSWPGASQPAAPAAGPAPGAERVRTILDRIGTEASELKAAEHLDTLLAFLKTPSGQDPDLHIQAASALVPGWHKNEGTFFNSLSTIRAGRRIRSAFCDILRDPDRPASDPALQPVARGLLSMSPWRSDVRGVLRGPQTAGRLQLAAVLAADPANLETYRDDVVPALAQALSAPKPQAGGGAEYERQAAVRALVDPVTLPSSWIPWRSERTVSAAGTMLDIVRKSPSDRQLAYYALGAVSRQRSFYAGSPTGKALVEAVLKAPAPAGDAKWAEVRTWARALKAYLDSPSRTLDPGQDVPTWP